MNKPFYLSLLILTLSVIILFKMIAFNTTSSPLLVFYSVFVTSWVVFRLLSGYFYTVPANDQTSFFLNVSVVIPAFNEEKAIEKTVDSWMSVDYPKELYEVIVVNDGSTDRTWEKLHRLKSKYLDSNLFVLSYQQNKGKRHAQKLGFDKARGDIIVLADSDSFPSNSDSIKEIIQPFNNPRVGGVCGHTEVYNVTNWITKMQKVRYWIAFDRYKRCESLSRGVICLSGCFSAIRRTALDQVIDKWYSQTFLGKRSNYGDDRALTTLMLQNNWETIYNPNAKAFTIVPDTFNKFWKQQLRWTKSFIRETWVGSKFIWKRPSIAFQFYIGAFITFASVIVAIYTIYYLPLFTFGSSLPFIYLFGLVLISLLSAVNYRYANNDNHWVFSPVWNILYASVLIWRIPLALTELKDTRWKTREMVNSTLK